MNLCRPYRLDGYPVFVAPRWQGGTLWYRFLILN